MRCVDLGSMLGRRRDLNCDGVPATTLCTFTWSSAQVLKPSCTTRRSNVHSLGPRCFIPYLMTFGHMEAPAESFVAQFESHAVQDGFYVHMEAPAESFSIHMDGVGTG